MMAARGLFSSLRSCSAACAAGAVAGRRTAAAVGAAAFHTSSSRSSGTAAAAAAGEMWRSQQQGLRLGVPGRSIFAGCSAFLRERAGRLYDSFFYSQGSTKYIMALVFPAVILYTRFRADTKLGYYVFINDESIYPDYSENIFETQWKNGKKFYVDDHVTVQQFKQQIYGDSKAKQVPENVKVACRGRVFEDGDNLALAVRAFCRRDPRILLFQDDLA